MENAHPRSSVIDLCRALAILLVIYGHAIEVTFFGKGTIPSAGFTQWQAIYSFHMAVFFVLSGVVHRRKPISKVLATSVSLVFFALLTHIAAIFFTREPSVWKTIRPLLTLQSFSLIVTWYLIAHAWVILLAQIFIRAPIVGRVAVVGILLAIFVASQLFNGRLFQVHALPAGALFYAIGAWARSVWPVISKRIKRGMVLPLVSLGVAVVVMLAPMNGGCPLEFSQHCSNHRGGFAVMFIQGRYGYIPLFLLSAVVGVSVIFGLARYLDEFAPQKLHLWLCQLGQNTISLLIINGFFLAVVEVELSTWFRIGSSALETVAWAVGLTMVQLLIAPHVQPFIARAVEFCDAAAEAIVSKVWPLLEHRWIGLFGSSSGRGHG